MNPTRFSVGLLLSLMIAVIPVGCGRDGPELGSVSGTVTLDGKPVPNAFIVFTPKGPGRASQTKSDEQGRFTLKFSASNEGALIGEHSVTVSTADITADDGIIPEIIPAKYNRKGSINVTVERGTNDIKLELESDNKSAK